MGTGYFVGSTVQTEGTVNLHFIQVLKDVGDIITSAIAGATNQIQQPTETMAETEDNIIWGNFDQMASVVDANPETSAVFLLQQCLEEPCIGQLEDPLMWWKDCQHLYKHIIPIALKYLFIFSTSVPCQHVFLKGGQVISECRSCVKPKNVQIVLF